MTQFLDSNNPFLRLLWVKKAYSVLLLLLFVTVNSSAGGAASSREHKVSSPSVVPLWKFTSSLKATETATISDIIQHSGFLPLTSHPNFGQSDAHYWFKVDLSQSEIKHQESLILEVENAITDYFELYRVRDNHIEKIFTGGDQYPFDQRPVHYRTMLIPIDGNQLGDLYYIHTWGNSPVMLPMYIGGQRKALEKAISDSSFVLFVLGIIFSMLLYNVFLYVGTRVTVYGWYVLYVGNVWCYLLFSSGIGFAFLWSDFPLVQGYIAFVFVAFFQWASWNFTRSFLKTKKFLPRLDRYLNYLSYYPLLALLTAFIDFAIVIRLLTLMTLIIVIVIPVVSVYVWRLGFKASGIFLFSWMFLIVGMLVHNITLMGGFPVNFFTLHSLELGVAFESVLLSFSLAYRIKTMELNTKLRDAEARRSLEAAYLKTESALSMAKASNSAKNAFLSNISHHVKTPIHAFYGNIQLLSSSDLNDSQKEKLEEAKDNAMELFYYMDNLLTYSEILGNDIVPIESKSNVKNEIDEVVEGWKRNNRECGANFTVNYDGGVPSTTYAEWIHVRKVLRVLFDGLLPRCKELKQLYLSAEIDEGGEGSIIIDIQEIITQDTTVIDNWVKEEILADEWEGLGLEYFVGRKLVEVIGAQLTYRPVSRYGYQLRFQFPCRLAKDEYASESRTSFPNVNVLVVDDNRVNIQIIRAMLEKLNIHVDDAESGEQAIEKTANNDYDIILMDCLMPGLSGQETAQKIRELHSSNQNTPILAVSANASDKDRESCLNAGMNDFISKPVRIEKLAQYLTRWVPEY